MCTHLQISMYRWKTGVSRYREEGRSAAQAEASLIPSGVFSGWQCTFPLLFTGQLVFFFFLCLSPHPRMEYTRQLWNRWLFLPAILWPLKRRLVTGRATVWIQRQIGERIRCRHSYLQKCCPSAHKKEAAHVLDCVCVCAGKTGNGCWLCRSQIFSRLHVQRFIFLSICVFSHLKKCLHDCSVLQPGQ